MNSPRTLSAWLADAGKWRKGAARPLARIARRYWRLVPVVMLLGLVASVLEGVGIGLLIPLVAVFLADSPAQLVPEPLRSISLALSALASGSRILAFGGAALGLIALKAMVQAANGALIAWIEGRIGQDIRNAMASKILSLEFEFFMKNDPNRLAHAIANDSWFAMEAARWTLSIIPAAAGLAVIGALLAWLDWRLFAIVLAGGAAIQALLFVFENRQRALGAQVKASDLSMWHRMLAIVNSMRVIRIFDQQPRELERFAGTTDHVRRSVYASQRLTAWVRPSLELLIAALFVLILVASYALGTPLPSVIAFLVLLSRGQPHADAISEARLGIASVRASIREVEWLLGQQKPSVARSDAPAPRLGQPVVFDTVSYAYPDGTAALSDANFTLKPGVATALLGRSGAGKTTVINLLCGLVEPGSGAIRIGGDPLSELDARAWRAHIGIAGQAVDLVDGTVAQNIAYGCPGASREAIEQVAAAAGAHDFIARLPLGYETEVGFEGLKLSGGQRQRIGLARALLRKPELLILDEATSAVDALSEREIIRLLAEHRHFRTALVISHRKSTLAACQEGIVLDHGRVTDAGPLASLAYFRTMGADDPE